MEGYRCSSAGLRNTSPAICERLLPDYKIFSECHNWGDWGLLGTALEESKRKLIDTSLIKQLILSVEDIIPDTDDYGDYDGSYALNAGAAVLELLEYLLDEDLTHILNISTYMFDTIDFKLSESSPTLTDNDLINHQELIMEGSLQTRLLKRLREAS